MGGIDFRKQITQERKIRPFTNVLFPSTLLCVQCFGAVAAALFVYQLQVINLTVGSHGFLFILSTVFLLRFNFYLYTAFTRQLYIEITSVF